MTIHPVYEEKISSHKTTVLFIVLTIFFFMLSAWRWITRSLDTLACVLLCFSVLFLFYSLNYRTLVIQIFPTFLKLRFGLFAWTESLENIEDCLPDELPALLRYGGAGIHFMNVAGRYRANFNFLQYPRVVVRLRKKRGLVRDLSFSTQQPEEILRHIRLASSAIP